MLTEAQRAARITYIGGSEAAAVLGMSRWSSPLQVWAEKTGLVQPEDISGKLPVKLGNKLEQAVAELFVEETKKAVHRVNETIFHPKHPFLAANLDRRVVGERSIVECKTASAWKSKEWEGEEIPVEYVIQVMHQLAVCGAERGYLAVLIGNQDFKVKTIERDEKALADLVRREVEFWEKFVVPKVMPAAKAGDRDTLTSLFPDAEEGKTIDLDSKAAAICELLEGMEADSKALDRQIEEQRNGLRAILGDAEVGLVGPWKIRWANQATRRLNMDALKKEMPEVYEKYRTSEKSRRLLISKREDADGQAG